VEEYMARKSKDESMPIQFMDSKESTAQFVSAHPDVPADLRKFVERCMINLDKISAKHGVSLGVSLSFKVLGE
jgi:hypothetical protein